MRNHFLRAGHLANTFIRDDLFVHYDFGNISCWNRTNGTNTADYTVYNLANSHNNALFRCKSGLVDGIWAYQHDSGSDAIIFDSSDGGGCVKFDTSEIGATSDDFALVIPGSESATSQYLLHYNLTTQTGSNNMYNGIGTGAFTIEYWLKQTTNATSYYLGDGTALVVEDTSGNRRNHNLYYYGSVWAGFTPPPFPGAKFKITSGNSADVSFYPDGETTATTSRESNWNHIVVSRASDATNGTTVYLNNVSQGTITNSSNLSTMLWGQLAVYDSSTDLARKLGIFRFYKGKALTSSEVTHNWNAQKSRFGH